MSSSYLSRVILIPSAVFLSALFGGAYGSGREVVEFISRHGPIGGLIAISTIALTYAVCMFLVYELARAYRAFELRGFAEQLLGKAKFLYEILIMIGLLLALAICSSAGGALAKSYFGLTEIVGGSGVLLIIVILTFFGRKIVEESMIVSVAALGVALVYLVFIIVSESGAEIGSAFSAADKTFDGVGTGMQYALTNCGFLTLLLYSIRDLECRSETVVASVAAGLIGVVPAIAFHLIFMTAYPDIVDEQLPSYWLIQQTMSATFLAIYVLIVFVLVAQTGVALLQGVLESLDQMMAKRRGKALTRTNHATISGLAVIAASVFASIGIVELIIRVYGFLSIAFFLVFFVPLFTKGAWLIWRNGAVSQ